MPKMELSMDLKTFQKRWRARIDEHLALSMDLETFQKRWRARIDEHLAGLILLKQVSKAININYLLDSGHA